MIVLIVCLIISFVLLCSYFSFRKNKHREFVINHSIKIKKLRELNSTYSFYDVKPLVLKNAYDNKKFYETISCQDYLIYQLQFIKYDVSQEIRKANYNNVQYQNYLEEVQLINEFNNFDIAPTNYNKKLLIKLESELFEKSIKHPTTDFSITIILYQTKMNERVQQDKKNIFNSTQIISLLHRLNNKNNYFYLDREIWDSLCRVERGKVSNKMRFAIYKRDHYCCQICGSRYGQLEIDHIKPIAKGGKTTYDNLQTLCKRCNQAKGDMFSE